MAAVSSSMHLTNLGLVDGRQRSNAVCFLLSRAFCKNYYLTGKRSSHYGYQFEGSQSTEGEEGEEGEGGRGGRGSGIGETTNTDVFISGRDTVIDMNDE